MTLKLGSESFSARLRQDLAPRSCECLLALLPYKGSLIHARWSGEAMWAPLAAVMAPGLVLPLENPKGHPRVGEVLLYAGVNSEPELLIPYGPSRFACKAGALEGNPVLSIEDGLERISRIGLDVLWRGALPLSIEVSP